MGTWQPAQRWQKCGPVTHRDGGGGVKSNCATDADVKQNGKYSLQIQKVSFPVKAWTGGPGEVKNITLTPSKQMEAWCKPSTRKVTVN